MISGEKINLNITDFKHFRQGKYVYIDKSMFIEHLLDEGNNIILFCRPRRMGKSMNLTMLKYFFDIKEKDTAELFRGLYIEKSNIYNYRNKYPVIHLNFRDLLYNNYKEMLVRIVNEEVKCSLSSDQISDTVKESAASSGKFAESILRDAMKNLYDIYGEKPYILIDEYDKLIMDCINRPEFENIRSFIKAVMASTLKDNPYLGRAVITGVNRIAQESLFSDLNNITICDVFDQSVFDTDFGFTEDEVIALFEKISASSEITNHISVETLRVWYNNCQIGNSAVYFSYSVLSALSKMRLGNYWGQSGAMNMIRDHLTPERVEQITELVNDPLNSVYDIHLKDRLTIDDLKTYSDDSAFYSLLVQTGYLTYKHIYDEETLVPEEQKIFLPNLELQRVWREFIFTYIYTGTAQTFKNMLRKITDVKILANNLTEAINNKLSYYDFEHSTPEKTYHVYIAGMMSALGYKWISNRESGLGRYDLLVQLPQYNLVFEFKVADTPEDMRQSALEAIAQIKNKLYTYSLDKTKPTFQIGIGFHKKMCRVEVDALCQMTTKNPQQLC